MDLCFSQMSAKDCNTVVTSLRRDFAIVCFGNLARIVLASIGIKAGFAPGEEEDEEEDRKEEGVELRFVSEEAVVRAESGTRSDDSIKQFPRRSRRSLVSFVCRLEDS